MKTLQNKSRFAVLSLSVLALFAASAAQAGVTATPSYQNFGEVSRGQSAMTTIHFRNDSATPIRFFNVYCSGDVLSFSCHSTCSYLPAFGSCSVFVRFTPYHGDGQRRFLHLNGYGDGNWASAIVEGVEAKTP